MSKLIKPAGLVIDDELIRRVDEALVAGKLKLPFGGKLRGRNDGAMVASPSPCATGTAMAGIGGGAGIVNYLFALAEGCRPRGARPPSDCVDANGCIRTRGTKVCGIPGPYRQAVASQGTASYELKALDWFLPLIWVDDSGANITITNLTYKGGPVFATPMVDVVPSGVFGAGDSPRYVPGLPAIDSTDGLKFELANDHATDEQDFAGMFIGIGVLAN